MGIHRRGGQRGGPRRSVGAQRAHAAREAAPAARNGGDAERTELVQEGVAGLLRAVERCEPGLGVPFWADAPWRVLQAMQQLVSELSRVRGPLGAHTAVPRTDEVRALAFAQTQCLSEREIIRARFGRGSA